MREYKEMNTSEVAEALQKAIEEHGDLPFVIRDSGKGIDYDCVSLFANTFANGGCDDEDWDEEQIGVLFMKEHDPFDVPFMDKIGFDPMVTSEVVHRLQSMIDEDGDLPFAICDSDDPIGYSEISVFIDTVKYEEGDKEVIGIAFE